jgi:hypothetical protein
LKTHEILLLIEEVVMVKPRNSSVTLDWSPALKDACLHFFSPPNLRRFLGFYWAIWHPNVNFVHRPTFDPLAAKPTVLAAMALIGKSYFTMITAGTDSSKVPVFHPTCWTTKMRELGSTALKRWSLSTTISIVN